MIIYLAGGISGNCFPLWRQLLSAINRGGQDLKLYLAGTQGRRWCVDAYLFGRGQKLKYEFVSCGGNALAGDGDISAEDEGDPPNILESFYYADEWTIKTIPLLKNFMLDSGAFTFFTLGKEVNWNQYIDRYIKFINENKVNKYFELDIDKLVGYPKVLEFRKELERQCPVSPIPVWHKSRGKNDFLSMCEKYNYVAIGGIVSKEITPKDYVYFPWFINEAHKRKAKIHGLGFTNLEGMRKYHFDSVDSTAWTTGNRFGAVYRFNGRTMVKYSRPEGTRLADAKEVAINNFNEWVKFQKYAEGHL